MPDFCLYALEFVKGRRRGVYVGIAQDFDRRRRQHTAGTGAKALRGAVIVRTVWRSEAAYSRAEAQSLEHRMKRLPAKAKRSASSFAKIASENRQ
jgi:putative endonuclease